MATFLTDQTEWMPLVRLKLGVDTLDLPDITLDNAILINLSEGRITNKLPGWDAHFSANPSKIKMAAVCFLASEFCDFCQQNIFTSESVGKTYSSDRPKTDWQEKKVSLVGEGFGYLAELDPSLLFYKTAIAIVSPSTPLFGSL